MEYKKLENLNSLLARDIPDYFSMIATGSIAVGDPFIEGRSDYDILLIFNENPFRDIQNVERVLSGRGFDDTYTFSPMLKAEFGLANSKYAFSNRFRSKTLFGEDLTHLAKLPDAETTQKMYEKGLTEVVRRSKRDVINSTFWSEDRVRDEFWKRFKHTFMYLAMREYHKTGDYPHTRLETAKRLDSNEVTTSLNVLHSIDLQPGKLVIDSARDLVNYLENRILPNKNL